MPKRTDANQVEIMRALRGVGAAGLDLSQVGHGVPDLLVWYRGRYMLMEVKSPAGRLTEHERRWHEAWPDEVIIVRSVDDALRAIGQEKEMP